MVVLGCRPRDGPVVRRSSDFHGPYLTQPTHPPHLPHPPYSYRSATIGSMRVARSAGR